MLEIDLIASILLFLPKDQLYGILPKIEERHDLSAQLFKGYQGFFIPDKNRIHYLLYQTIEPVSFNTGQIRDLS